MSSLRDAEDSLSEWGDGTSDTNDDCKIGFLTFKGEWKVIQQFVSPK